MKFGLSNNVLEKIVEVLSSFRAIDEAVIYGSRALGTYREGSDIDMTLKGNLSFNDLIQVEKELDEQMLPYSFDLSLYRNITNPDLLDHINRAGKILYERTPASLKSEK